MACICGSLGRRAGDRAGCVIAFIGVHRRSPRFRNGIAHRKLRANVRLIFAGGFLAAGGASLSAVTARTRRSWHLMTASSGQTRPPSWAAFRHGTGRAALRTAECPCSDPAVSGDGAGLSGLLASASPHSAWRAGPLPVSGAADVSAMTGRTWAARARRAVGGAHRGTAHSPERRGRAASSAGSARVTGILSTGRAPVLARIPGRPGLSLPGVERGEA
jgi:hypothetical protein